MDLLRKIAGFCRESLSLTRDGKLSDQPILLYYTPKRSVFSFSGGTKSTCPLLFIYSKQLRTKRSVNSLQDQTPTSEQARTRLFLNFVPFLHSPRAADTRATGRAGGRTIHHEQREQKQRVCTRLQRIMGGGRPYRAVTLGQDPSSPPAQHPSPGSDDASTNAVPRCARQL
jgi:hypothetical protein